MAAEGQITHGRGAYQRGACDCETCIEAVRAYSEKVRRRKGAKPMRPYTVLDWIALAEPTTSQECADKIGRSKSAVEKMRAKYGIGGPLRFKNRENSEQVQ